MEAIHISMLVGGRSGRNTQRFFYGRSRLFCPVLGADAGCRLHGDDGMGAAPPNMFRVSRVIGRAGGGASLRWRGALTIRIFCGAQRQEHEKYA